MFLTIYMLGMLITGPAAVEGAVRLVGGGLGPASGVLQLFRAGAWGSLTAVMGGWDHRTAAVACRSLGWKTGWYASMTAYGPGEVWNIAAGGFQCSGREARLEECAGFPADLSSGSAWFTLTHDASIGHMVTETARVQCSDGKLCWASDTVIALHYPVDVYRANQRAMRVVA
jgi:hypothetical protein